MKSRVKHATKQTEQRPLLADDEFRLRSVQLISGMYETATIAMIKKTAPLLVGKNDRIEVEEILRRAHQEVDQRVANEIAACCDELQAGEQQEYGKTARG